MSTILPVEKKSLQYFAVIILFSYFSIQKLQVVG